MAVLGDGLGGHGGGDVASAIAVEALLDAAGSAGVPGTSGDPSGRGWAAAELRAAFESANRSIFDAALDGRGARKMQTTLSALALSPGSAYLGHVGDSRIYRLRNGVLDLLTTDHTQAMEMLRLRLITPAQAAAHPARHALTRSLGADIAVRPDLRREALQAGDTFLICSDGLWGALGAAEIGLTLGASPARAAEQLVARAIERDGDDNASALVVRVQAAGQAPAAPPRRWRWFLP